MKSTKFSLKNKLKKSLAIGSLLAVGIGSGISIAINAKHKDDQKNYIKKMVSYAKHQFSLAQNQNNQKVFNTDSLYQKKVVLQNTNTFINNSAHQVAALNNSNLQNYKGYVGKTHEFPFSKRYLSKSDLKKALDDWWLSFTLSPIKNLGGNVPPQNLSIKDIQKTPEYKNWANDFNNRFSQSSSYYIRSLSIGQYNYEYLQLNLVFKDLIEPQLALNSSNPAINDANKKLSLSFEDVELFTNWEQMFTKSTPFPNFSNGDKLSSYKNSGKSIDLEWDYTRLEKQQQKEAYDLNSTWTGWNSTKSISKTAPRKLKLADILNKYSPQLNKYNIQLLRLFDSNGTDRTASGLSIPSSSKTANFYLTYPKDGHTINSGDNYIFPSSGTASFTYKRSQDDYLSSTWFNQGGGKLSITESGVAPSSLSSSDILRFFEKSIGGSKPSGINLSTNPLSFGKGVKKNTATVTYTPSDSSLPSETRQIQIIYTKSRNQDAAENWFNSIPSSSTITPSFSDFNKQLTIQDALSWLGPQNKPAGFVDPSFVGQAPKIGIKDKSISFTLEYPSDGQSGTTIKLPNRIFTIKFNKTILENETEKWWNGSSNISAANSNITLNNKAVPASLTRQALLQILNIKDLDKNDNIQKNFNDLNIYLSSSSKKINFPLSLPKNQKNINFIVKIKKDGINSYNDLLSKTFVINWSQTQDEKEVKDWIDNLKVGPTIAGHPPNNSNTPLNLNWFKKQIGWSQDPNVSGFVHPTVTANKGLSGNLTNSNSINPSNSDKSWTFTLRYRDNGVYNGNYLTKQFTISFNESRQDYLDNKVSITGNNSTKANGGLLGTYTAKGQTFGDVTSNIDTSNTPLTLNRIQNMTSPAAFTTTRKDLKIVVNSVSTNALSSGTYSGAKIKQTINLTLNYLNASRNVDITITYAKAMINPFVNQSDMQKEFNKITIGSANPNTNNTNNAQILVPQSLFKYFDSKHLIPSVVFDSSHKTKITKNKTTYTVPSGVLQNNNNGHSISLKLEVQPKPNFVGNTASNAASQVSKTLSWPIWIDTSKQVLFASNNNSNSGLISLALKGATDNWKIITNNNPNNSHFKILVRWNNNASSNSNSFVDIANFSSSNQIPSNIWDQSISNGSSNPKGDFKGVIEAKLVAENGYVLSADKLTTSQKTFFNQLTKIINPGTTITSGTIIPTNFFANIQSYIKNALNNNNDTNNISWGSAQSDLETYAKKNNIKISFSFDSSQSQWSNPSGNDNVATLPTNLDPYHGDRYFFVKIEPIQGFKLNSNSQNIIDMAQTAVPKIKQLIGWLDASKSIQSGSPKKGIAQPTQSTMVISDDTNIPSFNTPKLITGLKYEYSVDGTTWTNINDFKNNIKAITGIKANFQWKLAVTNPSKYVLSAPTKGKFKVSNLKTYLDISSEINALKSGIKYVGQFGQGKEVYIEDLNNDLSLNTLKTKRVKLQYKIDNINSLTTPSSINTWFDLPSYSVNGSNSIIGSRSSSKYIKIADGLIPAQGAPKIEFRFVPFYKDGGLPTSNNQTDSMTSFENNSTAVLSETKEPHDSQNIILPTIVSVGTITPGDFTFAATNGNDVHSKNFKIKIANSEIDKLKAAHTNIKSNFPQYWNNLHFVFSISDGSGVNDYGFLKDDFEKWLHGDYSNSNNPLPNVWKISNNSTPISQINMTRSILPNKFKVPLWNNLDTASLNVRWVTDTRKDVNSSLYYVASNKSYRVISNFSTQVLKWYDPSHILDAVKSVYITGDTNSYKIDQNNVVSNPTSSNTSFITDKYLSSQNLKRQFSIDGTNWVYSPNQPTYNSDSEKQQRNLYMRVVPNNGYNSAKPFVSSPPISSKSVYISYPQNKDKEAFNTTYKKQGSSERYFKYYVDTSNIDLFKGQSIQKEIISVKGSSTKIWNLDSSSNVPSTSHIDVLVRWVDSQNTNNPFVAISKLSQQVPDNIWDQSVNKNPSNGDFKGSVEAKLIPADSNDYVLSSPRQTLGKNSTIFKYLTKVITPGSISSNINAISDTNFLAKIQKILSDYLSNVQNTNSINWQNAQSDLEAYAIKNNIKISFSKDQNKSSWLSPANSSRVASLPTDLNPYHEDRYFFVKVEAIKDYKLDGNGVVDMAQTAVPKIKQLIGWLDASNSIQSGSPKQGKGQPTQSTMVISDDTNNPLFKSSDLITGLKYEYSVNGTTWTNINNFTKNIKAITEIKANFKWRLAVTDPSKYVLSKATSGLFDVSNLKTYLDISSEISTLQSGIKYVGQFGKGQKVYIEDLNNDLSLNSLKTKRVKLQYKITGINSINPATLSNWTDLPSNNIVSGTGIIGSRSSSKYIEIAQDLIPGNSSPVIEFRFVPFYDDSSSSTTTNPTDPMKNFEKDSTAVLSNSSEPHDSQNIILPTIVSVGTITPGDFTFAATNGKDAHSRNFQITIANSEIDKLKANNSNISNFPQYWSNLHFVFSISDGSGVKRYGFLKSDFESWLHGNFSNGNLPQVWEMMNSSNNSYSQIDMKQVTLPNQFKTPVWNNLDTTSLNVSWVTDTTKDKNGGSNSLYYAASDTSSYNITNFSTQVLKWYDPSHILDAVKSVYITGDTNSYKIDQNNVVSNPTSSNPSFITDTYLSSQNLKRQFSIDGTNWVDSPKQPTYNSDSEKQQRNLYMRVVPKNGYNRSKPFVSSSPISSKSVYISYPQNKDKEAFNTTYTKQGSSERYFKYYVDTSKVVLFKGQITQNGQIEAQSSSKLTTKKPNWYLYTNNSPNNSHFKILVRWVDSQNAANNPFVTISNLSKQVPNNIWDQSINNNPSNGDFKGSVEAKLIPADSNDYVLSSDRKTLGKNSIIFKDLIKVITPGSISSNINAISDTNFLANIQKILSDYLSNVQNTNSIKWQNAQSDLEAYAIKNNIKISFSFDSNQSKWSNPSGNDNVATLPTDLDPYHDDRYFFVKLEAIQDYELDGKGVVDMAQTAVPKIKQLIGWLDASNSIQSGSPKQGKGQPTQSTMVISDDTNNPLFKSPELITGLKYEYSVNGTTWTNINNFTKNIKAITEIKANFKWRLAVTDPSKYVLSKATSGLFDVSNLKTYLDISSEISTLQSGIKYVGQFGKGQKVYIEDLNNDLSLNSLKTKRVKLQYKISGINSINPATLSNWTDLPSNSVNGSKSIIGSRSSSKYIEIAQDLIPGNSSPVIEFRFVPFYDDSSSSTTTNPTDPMKNFEKDSTAVLSETKEPHDSQNIILPTIVSVGTINPGDFTFTATGGNDVHSRNFQITIAKSEMDKLQAANSNITSNFPKYWNGLHFVFSISDGSGVSDYGFLKDDFEKWLHGDYSNSNNPLPDVWKISNNSTLLSQIDMKQVKLPNQFKTPVWNNLDTKSLNVSWVTETTKDKVNGPQALYYAASDTVQYKLTNFENQVLKWYDPSKILDAVESVYIVGTTNSYSIDPSNVVSNPKSQNPSLIGNASLFKENLAREFSIDGNNWSRQIPTYKSWKAKNDRYLYMRVVPKNGYKQGKPFVSSKINSKSVYIAYPKQMVKASFKTEYKKTGTSERYFKVYVDANLSDLKQVKIKGTQFMLGPGQVNNEQQGVDESIDTNNDDYSVIEFQYQYNNNWYNKQDLIKVIIANRNPKSGSDLSSITFPKDFSNNNVKVRWHLTGDQNNYHLSSANNGTIYSSFDKANALDLKNFINIWKFQNETSKTLSKVGNNYSLKYNEPKNNTIKNGQLITPDYDLIGSLNSATLKLKGNIFTPNFIKNNNLKVQYSTYEFPTPTISGAGWIDATKNLNGYEIFNNVPVNNQHKSLWIRVIIDSAHSNSFAVSSYQGGGNSNVVQPIKIDATRMKFLITTDSSKLSNISMAGTSQLPTSSNLLNFFSGSDASTLSGGPGKWGIWYQKQVPGQNSLSTINKQNDAANWVAENGITIRWQVQQTRTSNQTGIPNIIGTVNYSNIVEFDDFNQLVQALKTSKLNFDSSSLKVQWGILPSQRKNNTVSDAAWVSPSNAADITNIIFSRDFVTLDSTSVVTSNNTIATTIAPQTRLTSKIPKGLQLEYSLDGTTNWSTQAPVGIGGNKALSIRLNPIPKPNNTGGYALKDPVADAQITSVDNSNVYIAIPLAQDNAGTKATSQVDWENYFKTTKVSGANSFSDQGYTTLNDFGIWTGITPAKQMPTILPAEDKSNRGHWEYSIDNFANVYLKLEDAMLDYYGSGTKSFDKDREQYFSIRYVLDSKEITLANNKAGYVFTDASGKVINKSAMSFNVDITNLTQYLYIDNPDQKLPSNQANTVTNMSWRQLANEPKFRPGFNLAASKISRYVDYTQMEYKGQYVDSQGNSLFKFDVNPFTNQLDANARIASNMLAPRHAHFEYSTKQTATSNWTKWSTTLPTDRPLESNNKYFRIRIAPDNGYAIPKSTFSIGNQNWLREFTVVILKNTEQITFDSIEYVGFNSGKSGQGRIKTDNKDGDFSKGSPLIELKKAGTSWSDYKDTSSSSAFVIEYNVFHNNVEINWTDTQGVTAKGWHSSKLAPSQSKKWYGDMPVSLKNGDVIHIRFRAKNGFVIDDPNSPGKKADDTAPYSSTIILPPVSGLLDELIIPTGFRIFDTKHNIDFNGKPINFISNMPTLSFAGSESLGTVNISPGKLVGLSDHIKFLVQVLRPTNILGIYFDANMKPINSYEVLDDQGKVLSNIGDVWKSNTGQWINDIDYIPNTWVDPSSINWLQVGDAVRIRVVAKNGYAFRWEDPKNSFVDINLTPKSYDQFSHNKNGVLSKTTNNPQGTGTPLPVTGLFVKPPKLPSEISLVYSRNPADNLQGNVQNMKTSIEQIINKGNHKWFLNFRVYYNSSGLWSNKSNSLQPNLYNGDKIEISVDLLPGYNFDPTYKNQNQPHIEIIQGLKDMIDMSNTSKPKITFAGYHALGYISAITPSIPNKPFETTKDVNGFPNPKIPSTSKKLGGVKWQYQVYESDPSSVAKSSIDLQPWLNTPPKNLKAGWYVRMRVAPNNPSDVVLAKFNNVYNTLYSESSYNDAKKLEHQKGWVEVKDLKLNPVNIGLNLKVSGFIGKTKVASEFTILIGQGANQTNTADEDAVIVEFQNDNFPGIWLNASDFNKKYGNLKNKDKVSVRVVPRNTNILSFDVNDPAIGQNGYRIETNNKTNYLRNDAWDGIEVSGLKKYINVSGVTLEKPNSLLGLGNFDPMSPGQKEKISGEVELIKAVLDGLNTVADVNGNKKDSTGKPYTSYLEIRYKTERINLDTGEYFPPSNSNTPPTKLKNGDRITIDLVVTDDTYKLSKNISTIIEVKDLQEIIGKVEWPKFTFFGESGSGSVKVDNSSPTGFKWEFTVQYKNKSVLDGQEMWSGHNYIIHSDGTVTEVEEFTNKGNTSWRERNTGKIVNLNTLPTGDIFKKIKEGAPIDLSNGDEIKARLVSVRTKQIARLKDPKDPSKSSLIITPDWTTVSGLTTTIDLSSLRIKVWNDKKPYKPNDDNTSYKWTYPFKIEGKQEESSSIVIDALINPINGSRQLLDTDGNPIPFADKLEWEFAVDYVDKVTETTSWTKSIPKGLKSKQFIHVRLAVRRGVENTVVRGFIPQTFQIPELSPAQKISSNIVLFVGLGIFGVVIIGGLGGLLFAIRTRRKLNYRIKPKM